MFGNFVTASRRNPSKAMNRPVSEEHELIRQVLKGDQPAFQRLVERYQDYVFTIVLRILSSREEAEEVAMDVFLKVYQSLRSFEFKSKFSTWLYTIAYRMAIDRVRTKQFPIQTLDNDERFLQVTDREAKGPEARVASQDLQNALRNALERLKPADAGLVSLYYLQEKSVQEVSEVTGLSVSNVKVKLYRLRSELRAILEQQLRNELSDLL